MLRVRVHGRGAAEPGRVARERREVREARRVHALCPVHERDRRELVEDDQHDGCLRTDGDRRRLRRFREDELRHRRVEEEEGEEDDRRRDENREERLHRLYACVERCDAEAGERRGDERAEPRKGVGLRECVEHDHRDEARDEDEVQQPCGCGADEPDQHLGAEQHGRRQHRERDREQDDLSGGGVTDREEGRILAEDVEERLREREAR